MSITEIKSKESDPVQNPIKPRNKVTQDFWFKGRGESSKELEQEKTGEQRNSIFRKEISETSSTEIWTTTTIQVRDYLGTVQPTLYSKILRCTPSMMDV